MKEQDFIHKRTGYHKLNLWGYLEWIYLTDKESHTLSRREVKKKTCREYLRLLKVEKM